MRKIALAMLLLVVASVSAQSFPATFCSDLFSGANANNKLLSAGTYTDLLGVSLLVVLLVLVVLGVVYAFGMAFRVESLKAFTKSELLESFFNIILIVVIASGVAFSGSAIASVTNIGLAGIQSVSPAASACGAPTTGGSTPVLVNSPSGSPTCWGNTGTWTATCDAPCAVVKTACDLGGEMGEGVEYSCANPIVPIQAVAPTDTLSVYTGICNNYVTSGINDMWANIEQGQVPMAVLSLLLGYGDSFKFLGNGVALSPLMGAFPIVNILSTQIGAFDALIGLLLVVTFFLFIIYSIFPVFLYVGILFRSFPWTRAAGGTFIAMFIAFYIIFPAILYPFSLYMQSISVTLGLPTGTVNWYGLSSIVGVIPYLSGTWMLTEIGGFAQSVAATGLQLMGILIGFVVSLDLVEAIGKLLGAPSTHTRSLLGKLL